MVFFYNLFRLPHQQGIAGGIRDGTAGEREGQEPAKRTVPLSKASWDTRRRRGRVSASTRLGCGQHRAHISRVSEHSRNHQLDRANAMLST